MRAAWYGDFGPAAEVLKVSEVRDPSPRGGEVLVRVHASGVNPSDVKLRAGARAGANLPGPQVIPHSDGAGVIEAVGTGVDASRVGQRVWLWNGHWRRAHGTCAERIVLPADQAVPMPDAASFEAGACLGIPAMTAWYALWGEDLAGKAVLVHGAAGAVGRYAVQMAALLGADPIIATASDPEGLARAAAATHTINYRTEDVAARALEITDGRGVDRIVEVDFGANQAADLAMIAETGTISAFASAGEPEPRLSFMPFMFKNVTLRMILAYLIPEDARRAGEAQLGQWLADDALDHAIAGTYPLADAVAAHEAVEAGGKRGTVVVTI